MDTTSLQQHIKKYLKRLAEDPVRQEQDAGEREKRAQYYRSWTMERILAMTEEE